MRCDMCGGEGKLYKTIIEGAELNACSDCSKFGKVIAIIKEESSEEIKKQTTRQETEKDILEVVVEDFADRVKKKREQLNLTQKDFAKKLSEKESIIHKIETGSFVPPFGLAKKLERLLHIKLIEQHEESHKNPAKSKVDNLTIGDFIKTKKK